MKSVSQVPITAPKNSFKSKDNRREHGASLVEYGLLVVLIAIVCISGVRSAGKVTKCKMHVANLAVGSRDVPPNTLIVTFANGSTYTETNMGGNPFPEAVRNIYSHCMNPLYAFVWDLR